MNLPDYDTWLSGISITDTLLAEGIKRRGRDFICPFHSEKKPSLHTYEAQGTFHCFGCHARGDAVSFIRKLHNLPFLEAIQYLGYPVKDFNPAQLLDLKQHILRHKKKSQMVKNFSRWQLAYMDELASLSHLAHRIFSPPPLTPEELEHLWPAFHNLPVIEYHMDVLTRGSDHDIIALAQDRIDNRCQIAEAIL